MVKEQMLNGRLTICLGVEHTQVAVINCYRHRPDLRVVGQLYLLHSVAPLNFRLSMQTIDVRNVKFL